MDIQQIKAVNLSCVRQQKNLFSNISFSVSSGELLLIEGPNGSGKSSLLRLLSGLAAPFTGDIAWQGKSIYTLHTHYHTHMHYIGHANGIKLGLTVIENLQLTQRLLLSPMQNAHCILQSLKLDKEKSTPAFYLSAGQKRRLALAKLFLYPKTIWILDEPLTALDANTQEFFLMQLTLHLQKGGIAIISSHHSMVLNNISMQTLRLTAC